jgi:hypothetical protein
MIRDSHMRVSFPISLDPARPTWSAPQLRRMMVSNTQLDIRTPPLRASGFPTSRARREIEHLSRDVGAKELAIGARSAW